MTLNFSVLASGSTGNAFFIGDDKEKFLIDAGLSGKQIEEKLLSIGEDIKDIKGIFITHEHSDHIKGVGILGRKHEIPIYANEQTWKTMKEQLGNLPIDCIQVIEAERHYQFGDIELFPFHTSHDAVEPFGYNLYKNNQKLTYITDTGYINGRVKDLIKGSHTYIFESNHDVRLLQMGRYPWHIKKRILGDEGHLSNEDAAVALSEVMTENSSKIYLAHLSREHNLKELASKVCEDIIGQYREDLIGRFQVYVTDPSLPTVLQKV